MISGLKLPKRMLRACLGPLCGRKSGDTHLRGHAAPVHRPAIPGARPVPSAARAGARLALVVRLTLGALGLSAPHGALADGSDCVPREPPGYRMSEFRAPVPCTLAGASVVSTEEMRRLIAEQPPVLIDVLPSPRRPEGLSEDAIWQPPARSNIPGSVWLPNTGFGVLPLEEEAYLRANLERVTEGDPSRHVVFYCLADCWMSWNAARRALEWGYTSVVWYPLGSDGWEAANLPLAESSPVPREAGQ